MIARPKPEPDDGPEPLLVTPKRLSAELVAIATRTSQLRIRAQSLAVFFGPDRPGPTNDLDRLIAIYSRLGSAADELVSLASAVRVGQVVLDERYLDPAHRPERPLLDLIRAAPLTRVAEQIAPDVVARGDTDHAWDADAPVSVEVEARACNKCNEVRPGWMAICPHCQCPEFRLISVAADSIEVTRYDIAPPPPPEHPAAAPARAAAKRRKGAKGQGKPADPSEWQSEARDEELAAGLKAALDRHLPVGAEKGGES